MCENSDIVSSVNNIHVGAAKGLGGTCGRGDSLNTTQVHIMQDPVLFRHSGGHAIACTLFTDIDAGFCHNALLRWFLNGKLVLTILFN